MRICVSGLGYQMKNLVGCIGYGIRSLNLGQYEQHQAMHKTVWNARASLLALSITDRIVCGASHSEMERRARNRAGMAEFYFSCIWGTQISGK